MFVNFVICSINKYEYDLKIIQLFEGLNMSKVIGIDLGTTNSCVSVFENGAVKIIENAEGSRITPSVVAYTPQGEKLVGVVAKNQHVTNPKGTFTAIKRLIGRKFDDPVVKKDMSMVSYDIVRADNGAAWVSVNGKKISPEQISADILLKLKQSAEEYLGCKVVSAVITVPAYFDDSQRQATKDAGRIAGLDVCRIINEPTAAALAYGLDKKPGNIVSAVYDLGGGTFDISIIEIADVGGEQQIEVLSTNGDTFLGGEDFDNCIINYLIDGFKKTNGVDLHKDPIALQRLKEVAEKSKIELSTTVFSDVNLPYITAGANGPQHLNVRLTRAKLEELVDHLILKTLKPCELALKDAKKTIDDIDSVIMVGGQTRMPKVRNIIKDFFKKPLKTDVNPDESVSMGAAIQAAVLSGGIKDILLLDVTPLSLGLETMGGVMTKIINRNTTVPTKKTQIFSTAVDNQASVTIRVYQGEREKAASNKLLGQFDLHDIPPAARGVPQIEVTFDIDANGILHVSAKDKATNKQHGVDIKGSSSLSEDEVSKMVADAKKNEDSDRDFRELGIIKNNADTLIYTTERTLKDYKDADVNVVKSINECITKLKSSMDTDNKLEIEKCTESLTNMVAKLTSTRGKDVGDSGDSTSTTTEGEKMDNVVEAEFVDTSNINKDKNK